MISATSAASGTGWYGKLPALGDFASRRLPPEFIEAWDQWLARGLADWQAREPDWLTHYLQGPSWRFLIAPGVFGDSAWAGVLMPSVDQVGRYFPLCIAGSRPRLPGSAEALQTLLDWLLRLDDLALDAMQYDWPIATLEDELQRVGDWPADMAECASPLAQRVADALSQPQSQSQSLVAGLTLWISRDDLGAPFLYRHPGLPGSPLVSALLSGRLFDRSTTTEEAP